MTAGRQSACPSAAIPGRPASAAARCPRHAVQPAQETSQREPPPFQLPWAFRIGRGQQPARQCRPGPASSPPTCPGRSGEGTSPAGRMRLPAASAGEAVPLPAGPPSRGRSPSPPEQHVQRLGPVSRPCRGRRRRAVRLAAVMPGHARDDVLRRGRDVNLRRGQVHVAHYPLQVGLSSAFASARAVTCGDQSWTVLPTGHSRPDPRGFTPLDRYLIASMPAVGRRVRGRTGGEDGRCRRRVARRGQGRRPAWPAAMRRWPAARRGWRLR